MNNLTTTNRHPTKATEGTPSSQQKGASISKDVSKTGKPAKFREVSNIKKASNASNSRDASNNRDASSSNDARKIGKPLSQQDYIKEASNATIVGTQASTRTHFISVYIIHTNKRK